ncbi:MAG TPA: hypothetical protein DD001_21140 [Microcoleaceae bacterium UBA10368]|jgi:hypothetical protein|nr:hypothetical protein [Microcoleaceae cyanobacterium UBA10368]
MKAFELIKYIKTAILLFNIYDSEVIPGNFFLELCRNDVAVGWVERSETQHNRRVAVAVGWVERSETQHNRRVSK